MEGGAEGIATGGGVGGAGCTGAATIAGAGEGEGAVMTGGVTGGWGTGRDGARRTGALFEGGVEMGDGVDGVDGDDEGGLGRCASSATMTLFDCPGTGCSNVTGSSRGVHSQRVATWMSSDRMTATQITRIRRTSC